MRKTWKKTFLFYFLNEDKKMRKDFNHKKLLEDIEFYGVALYKEKICN